MSQCKWYSLIVLSVLFFSSSVGAGEHVRESVIAGTWYTNNPKALYHELTGYLKNVPVQKQPENLVALIAPHAGYRYSGQVAAHAYKLLENRKFETVVVIAPSHSLSFEGVSVYDRGGYQTPLGVMPLDNDFIGLLKSHDKTLKYVPGAHTKEHSLEIQVPFLQIICPGSRLVPLVMGDQEISTCKRLAKVLAVCAKGRSVLIVASSDLSHYHSAQTARLLDEVVFSHVARMDGEGLGSDLNKGRCEACGGGPMITAMMAAKLLGADKSKVLHAATSGDVTGDQDRVVGYMAAAFWQKSNTLEDNAGVKETAFLLTEMDKNTLHDIAKAAISNAIDNKTYALPDSLSETLKTPCGAFVTLKIDDKLRGCIGHVVGRKPLAETVRDMAVAAAMEDPRFSPLTKMEWPKVHLEISVMSPLRKVADPSRIVPGRHGIYIKKGWRSGLLLPQVATEYGWDRGTFLEQTCRKAGLPKDAWRASDTEIFIFSAEVF